MALWSLFGRESSEEAFCVLGHFGVNARSLDFASGSLCESDAALGMPVCLRDDRFSWVMESGNYWSQEIKESESL
jgi:hypothetical protein